MGRALFAAGLIVCLVIFGSGLFQSTTATPQIDDEFAQVGDRHGRWEVMYRRCDRVCEWRFYDSFREHEDAERAAAHLRVRGYEVKILHRD